MYVGDEMIGDIVLRDTASRLGGEDIDRLVAKGNPAVQISRAGGDRRPRADRRRQQGHDRIPALHPEIGSQPGRP